MGIVAEEEADIIIDATGIFKLVFLISAELFI